MKRPLILTSLAILTIALASCSMDEVKEVNQGNAIGFRPYISTRGLDISWLSDLNEFYVTAYKEDGKLYFKDVAFFAQGESFISAETYYWPKGETLTFHAYTPSAGMMGVSSERPAQLTFGNDLENKNVPKIENFVVKNNLDDQKDLIYAIAQGNEAGGDVEINFKHLLSKVEVRAYTSSEYEYTIAGVRIGGVNMTGTLNAAGPSDTAVWASTTPGVCEKIYRDEPITMKRGMNVYPMGEINDCFGNIDDNYAFMIPQRFDSWNPDAQTAEKEGAYISVLIQVNKNGLRIYPEDTAIDYEWVSVPIPTLENGWQAGVAYYYTLNFTNGIGYNDNGDPVLDNSIIKIDMDMTPMENATEGLVINPKMVGEWKGKYFEFRNYDRNTENDPWIEDESECVIIENDMVAIGQNTQNFGHIKIYDGTKMWTDKGNGVWAYTDYYMDGEKMYIDVYHNNDGSYDIIPQIVEISEVDDPAREVTVKVVDEYSTYSKNEIIIKYDIIPIEE